MLQALLVTFREGIESFLIVGVVVAYLKKSQRPGLVRGVKIGLAISALSCTVGAWLWLQVPNQPLYEGIAALTGALVVGVLLVQMLRTGRHMRADIEARVDRLAGDRTAPSARAVAGVALVTALLVTREGLEAVLFLGVQAFAAKTAALATGAALGLVGAAAIAWTWSRFSHRLNMGLVLRVTTVFLVVFLVQLLIYGVHELAESGVIQGSQAFHDATERFGPDGDVGKALAFSLAGAPVLYLILARLRRRRAILAGPAAPPPPGTTERVDSPRAAS